MRQEQNAITNLVFEGGGTKGAAYAGCVNVLEEQGLYQHVRRVAGTSAGSITASLLACGGGSVGLSESVHHTDFGKFIADRGGLIGDAMRFTRHYGVHTGDEFVAIFKADIERFAGNAELTFGQLQALVDAHPARYKALTVVATNLSRQQSEVFSAHCTPDIPIWQAVRASISIPLVFEPMKIGGQYYVDGGLALNFPIDIYDKTQVDTGRDACTLYRNPQTLGFYLEPQALVSQGERYNPGEVEIDSLKGFALAMGSFLTEAANSRYIHPDDKFRTVFIDDLGVKSTDFDAPRQTIEALIASGRKATEVFLAQRSAHSELKKTG